MALWRNEVKNGKDIRLMEHRERTYRSYSVFFKAYCLAMKFECDAVLRPSSCSSCSSSSSWHFLFLFLFFIFYFLPSTSPWGVYSETFIHNFNIFLAHASLYDMYILHYASSFGRCDIRPR